MRIQKEKKNKPIGQIRVWGVALWEANEAAILRFKEKPPRSLLGFVNPLRNKREEGKRLSGRQRVQRCSGSARCDTVVQLVHGFSDFMDQQDADTMFLLLIKTSD